MPISAYDQINYAAYKPLSIQEIWAPGQAMRAQHDQLSEELAQQEQAGGLSLLGLKEGIDDEAIKIHKTYMDETKKAADELATKGFIDSGRRRNLYGLKQKYNNEVLPLENQLKIRQSRAEELRRMQLQDPTFRATMNPNEVGLIAGLKNPEAFSYSGVSGNQMYKSVAEKANQLSKVIEQEHPELIKSGLSYNYFTAVQSGASLEQVDAAMRRQFNPEDVDKMTNLMRGVVESTFNEFGVPQKFANNQKVQDELWQTASQGLYAALGSKQFGTMQDSWGMAMNQRAMDAPQSPLEDQQVPFDFDYDPEITDSKKYKDITSKYGSVDYSNYKPSVEFKKLDSFKRYQAQLDRWMDYQRLNPKSEALPPQKPKEYDQYQNSLKIEEMSRKYKSTKPSEIKKKYEEDVLSMQKANKVKYIDDIDDVAKEHYLTNIISNPVLSKKFKNEIGEDPQEIINDPKKMKLLRFGVSAREGLFAKYSPSSGKSKKAGFGYEVSGNQNSINDIKINQAYSNAYEENLTGSDLVQTGHFQKVDNGYVTTTMNVNGQPVFISESEVKEGLNNPKISALFDAMINKIHLGTASWAMSGVDAQPVKVGGGR